MINTVNLVVSAILSSLFEWTNSDIGQLFASVLIVALVVRIVLSFFRFGGKKV